MKYILVKVSKNKWVVAETLAVEGQFRAITKQADRSIAEIIYNNVRFHGLSGVPVQFEHLLID